MCECGSLKVDEVAIRCFDFISNRFHDFILECFDEISDDQKLALEADIIEQIDSYLKALENFGFLCPELSSKVLLKVKHQFTATYKNGIFVRNWS